MSEFNSIMLTGEVASVGLARETAFVFGGGPEPKVPRRILGAREAGQEIEKLDVFLNPDATIQREYDQLEADLQAHQSTLDASIDLPAETLDGTRIELRANISKSADAEAADRVKADGVGLFRTEFAFQVHERFPTEDEQVRIYATAAERIKPYEVVIRELDIGSDKLLPYFSLPAKAIPSLGCRGTRLLLAHPEILDMSTIAEVKERLFSEATDYGISV